MRDIGHLIKREITRAQERRCAYCNKLKDDLTLEHIHPTCYGGKHDWINLVATCYRCNHRKGNMFVDSFLEKHPKFAPNFQKVVNESPVTLARSLIVFYMAQPIVRTLPFIKEQFDLTEQEHVILGYGLLNYFDHCGRILAMDELQARQVLNSIKGKLGCIGLREIYTTLWELINA